MHPHYICTYIYIHTHTYVHCSLFSLWWLFWTFSLINMVVNVQEEIFREWNLLSCRNWNFIWVDLPLKILSEVYVYNNYDKWFIPLYLQFHSLALSSNLFRLPINLSVDRHLNHLFKCAQHVICSHQLMKHKVYNTYTHSWQYIHYSSLQPSMLALAVLGCDLKLLECDWLSTILSLQTLSQVSCYLFVSDHIMLSFTGSRRRTLSLLWSSRC